MLAIKSKNLWHNFLDLFSIRGLDTVVMRINHGLGVGVIIRHGIAGELSLGGRTVVFPWTISLLEGAVSHEGDVGEVPVHAFHVLLLAGWTQIG